MLLCIYPDPITDEDDNHLLVLDLLSVHLIRDVAGSTIISLHPDEKFRTTTASYLHERIRFAGKQSPPIRLVDVLTLVHRK